MKITNLRAERARRDFPPKKISMSAVWCTKQSVVGRLQCSAEHYCTHPPTHTHPPTADAASLPVGSSNPCLSPVNLSIATAIRTVILMSTVISAIQSLCYFELLRDDGFNTLLSS